MRFEFDVDELKEKFITFFYKNKLAIIFFFIVFVFGSLSFLIYKRNEYEKMLESSDALIEYIEYGNKEFFEKEHKSGYKLIKEIFELRDNPSVEKFEYFASQDDYVFKNLFYFSKQLLFWEEDDLMSYYKSDKNPWHGLVMSCGVFNSFYSPDLIKNKPLYLLQYVIGLGKSC